MLRVPAVGRALSSTSLLAPAIRRSSPKALHIRSLTTAQEQVRGQSSHAVSNPTLANIEKRWEAMPPQEQAELWMALRDRMTVDWNQLTLQEKKACKFLSVLSSLFQHWLVCTAFIGLGPNGHFLPELS